MQREAQQLDQLFFAHRRALARKNPESYMNTLCEDDRRLKVWANERIERHLWVEATCVSAADERALRRPRVST